MRPSQGRTDTNAGESASRARATPKRAGAWRAPSSPVGAGDVTSGGDRSGAKGPRTPRALKPMALTACHASRSDTTGP